MELNLLNKEINKGLDTYHKVSKYQFYSYYLKIINKGYWTLNEICLLASIMSRGKSFDIKRKGSTKLIGDVLGISTAQVSNYKNKLIDKGYLTKSGKLIPPLLSIISILEKKDRIKFTLPMEIE